MMVQANGAYHYSVLAGQTSSVKTEIPLLTRTANPNQSVINSDVLSAKRSKIPCFKLQLSVWPASSDFWY